MTPDREFDVAMRLHDVAMSRDGDTAAIGRFMKATLPVLAAFSQSEGERSDANIERTTCAVTFGFAVHLAGIVMCTARPGMERDMAKAIAEMFTEVFTSRVEVGVKNPGIFK